MQLPAPCLCQQSRNRAQHSWFRSLGDARWWCCLLLSEDPAPVATGRGCMCDACRWGCMHIGVMPGSSEGRAPRSADGQPLWAQERRILSWSCLVCVRARAHVLRTVCRQSQRNRSQQRSVGARGSRLARAVCRTMVRCAAMRCPSFLRVALIRMRPQSKRFFFQ